MLRGESIHQTVMFAHKQRVQAGKCDVVVDARITGYKQCTGSGTECVAWQQILSVAVDIVARTQLSARIRGTTAKDGSSSRVGTVYLGGIQKCRGKIGLLAWVCDTFTGVRIKKRSRKLNRLVREEDVVAGRYLKCNSLGGPGHRVF